MSKNDTAAPCGSADPTDQQPAEAQEQQMEQVLEQILEGEQPETNTDGAQLSADQDAVIADTDAGVAEDLDEDDDEDDGDDQASCGG